MRLKRTLTTSLFILVSILIAVMIYFYKPLKDSILYPLIHTPIVLNNEDKLLFYKGGFAITGESTRFFNENGEQIPCPFSFEDDNNQNFTINDITDNYLLINGVDIYKLDNKNMSKVFTLESPALSIEEFEDYLLLTLENQNNTLEINFLNLENNTLSDLGFEESLYYFDLDKDHVNSTLSIIALDLTGHYPSSKILHYDHNLSLFGVTSSTDQVFYRIFRFPAFAVLVGNHKLICYNIDGDIEWIVENNRMTGFQAIRNKSDLLISLGSNIQTDQQGESFNGIYLNKDGDRQNITLPTQLSLMSPYKDRFIGLQYGKNILIVNKDGKVDKQYILDKAVKEVFWTPYQPDHFFVLNLDDTLQIYSTDIQDETERRMGIH